jgi:butyrate kinase
MGSAPAMAARSHARLAMRFDVQERVGGHLTPNDALVLTVSPAADATVMALFRGTRPVRMRLAPHGGGAIGRGSPGHAERVRVVRAFLEELGVAPGELHAVVGRGGVPRAPEDGAYEVSDELLRDAARAGGPGADAAPVAREVAGAWGCRAFLVDPDRGPAREEDELLALAEGALRVLSGEEPAKRYR